VQFKDKKLVSDSFCFYRKFLIKILVSDWTKTIGRSTKTLLHASVSLRTIIEDMD